MESDASQTPAIRRYMGRLTAIAGNGDPCNAAAMIIYLFLLAGSLAPFDFTRNTMELHQSLRRVKMPGELELVHAIADAPAVVLFAWLGFLTAASRVRECGPGESAFASAVGNLLLLTVMIECVKVFTRSNVVNCDTALIRMIAGILGAWYEAFCTEDPLPKEKR